jgi:hypothetical protein
MVSPVDEQVVRAQGQLLHGQPHGQQRCPADVDAVDGFHIDCGHSPGDGVLPDLARKLLRFFSESFFESVSPFSRNPGARMTAAATTGPNIGPRPTSSRPAMRRAPCLRAAFSCFQPHTGDLGHGFSI